MFFTPGHAHGEMTEEREEATQAAAVRGRGPGRGDPIEGEIGQGFYTYFSDILKFFSVREFDK